MNRQFRLTRTSDFQRVRQSGKSFAHPLIVLVALPSDLKPSQFAVAAGRSVGGAVQRNRAKRLVREALRPLIPGIAAGWQVVFICRSGAREADFHQMQSAVRQLLKRAKLLKEIHESGIEQS